MKRLIFVVFVLLLVVTGCSNGKNEGSKDGAIDVDKKLFDVSITVPAAFYEEEDGEIDVESIKKQDGIKNAIVNADGSVTVTMTKDAYAKTLKEMKDGILEYIDEIKNDGEYTSIVDVEYNKDFSKFTLEVMRKEYENSFDGMVSFGLGIQGMFYQIYSGIDSDDLRVTIDLKDSLTKEIFDTIVYPDDMK